MLNRQTVASVKRSLVRAYADSGKGGIESVNRFVIEHLARRGELDEVCLPWDDLQQAKGGGTPPAHDVREFARLCQKCLATLFGRGLPHSGDRCLVMHINYALAALVAGGRGEREYSASPG